MSFSAINSDNIVLNELVSAFVLPGYFCFRVYHHYFYAGFLLIFTLLSLQVTLAGQSAGAQSIMLHLIDESITGMFAQVIIQSVPISIPFRSRDEAIEQTRLFTAELGCHITDLYCMRNKSADDVIRASSNLPNDHFASILTQFEPWIPVENGDKIPKYFELAYGTNTASKHNERFTKPIIIGTIEHEATSYIYNGFDYPLSAGEYFLLLVELKKFKSFSLYFNYPSSNVFDARKALSNLATDFIFKCPTRMVANQMQLKQTVWLYSMEQGFEREEIWTGSGRCKNLACHGEDVPYLFQTFERGGFELSTTERNITDSIVYYFTNFVRTGNPNVGGTSNFPIWPKYVDAPSQRENIVWKAGQIQVAPFSKYRLCNLWDMFRPYVA